MSKMKIALPFLLLILSALAVSADILANGDFHDGKAHWKGDVKSTADRDSYDMSTVGHDEEATGIIITLKGGWTKAYQTFNTHESALDYSITFKLSGDYAPVAHAQAPMGGGHFPPPMPGQGGGTTGPINAFLSWLLEGPYSGDITPPAGPAFKMYLVDMEDKTVSEAEIQPKTGTTDAQTITGTFSKVVPHEEKTLYIVFPQGQGSVTLQSVKLTPSGTPATPQSSGMPGLPPTN